MEKPTGIAAIKAERDEWAEVEEQARLDGNWTRALECFSVANRLTWALSMLGAETVEEAEKAMAIAREMAHASKQGGTQ